VKSMPRPIHETRSDSEDQDGFFARVLTKLNSLWVSATYPFARKGRNMSLHYGSEISRRLSPRIWLGDDIEIGRHSWLSMSTEWNNEINITIEDNCRIGARCTISAENSIHLKRGVVLGSDVLVIDSNHAYEDVSMPITQQGFTPGGRIRIEEGCRIGNGAAILCDRGELVLGRNCIVAPGAVVTRSFPPNSLLSGNPARAVQGAGAALASVQPVAERIPIELGQETVRQGTDETGFVDSALFASTRQHASVKRPTTKQGSSVRGVTRYSQQVMRDEDPLSWFSRAAIKLRTVWLAWTYPFASFGRGAWVHYSCRVARSAAPYISLGEGVGFARGTRLDVCEAPGTDQPVLIMEDGSGMQRRGVISARNRVHVMKDVMFGFSVLVMDHVDSDDEDDFAGGQKAEGGTIRIEEECWIGSGAMILCEQGELVIGRHSVVGANSVVRRSIPPYSVVAGDPARIVKQYDFSKGKWVVGCIRPTAAADRQQPDPPVNAAGEASTCESAVPNSAGEVSRGVR
jgi:acetyltransferase-like isoleucine patch superfamily enzyme